MVDLLQYPISVTLVLLALHYAFSRLRARKRTGGFPLPPGPKGYPLIGAVNEIGAPSPWILYSNLAKQYGDIVYIEALGQKVLLLSSLKRTAELLEGRSSIYSDRPKWTMVTEHMGYDIFIGVLRYGTEWRRQRRMVHHHFNPMVVSRYHPVIERATVQYLQSLLSTPLRFYHHTQTYFNRVIVKATYGIDIVDEKHPYITKMNEVAVGFGIAGVPGAFLVDLVPALRYIPRWMPGAGWRKFADTYRAKAANTRDEPFDQAVKSMQEGNTEPCIVTRIVESLPADQEKRKEEERLARNTAATMYFGGADTGLGTGMTIIMVLAMYPDIQQRAQEEIDRLVGFGRLPTFEDRPKLVYINAFLKELFRWHQLGPLALPHATSEDDVYDGYFIPKGAVVISNVWHILHDEIIFKDPFNFDPERFIKNGKINGDLVDPYAAAFGFGRRVCPGRHMALDSIYAFTTGILSMFDVIPMKDEQGNSKVKGTFSGGLLMHPDPFECLISPRSEAHAEALGVLQSQ